MISSDKPTPTPEKRCVTVGAVKLVPHIKGGWAIPGGGRARSEPHAYSVAGRINRGLNNEC